MASSLLSFTITRIVAAKHTDDTLPVLNENIKTLLTLLNSVQEEQRKDILFWEKGANPLSSIDRIFCSLHHFTHTNHLTGRPSIQWNRIQGS